MLQVLVDGLILKLPGFVIFLVRVFSPLNPFFFIIGATASSVFKVRDSS